MISLGRVGGGRRAFVALVALVALAVGGSACVPAAGAPSASVAAVASMGSAPPSPGESSGRPAAPSTAPAPRPTRLVVFAAASLKSALTDVATAYRLVRPGTALTIATDSSATLRAQLEQGAPADVFLSADSKNPDSLAAAGLTDGPAVPFAGNSLTIVVPAVGAAARRVSSPMDLARPGLRIIATGANVPLAAYAEHVVAKLAALPGYPVGFAAAYESNVVSREANATSVVTRVALGEGDAGIVYATDARAFDGVATIAVPATANVVATYAGVVLRASPDAAEAHAFLDWLVGPGGRSVLAARGFLPPP